MIDSGLRLWLLQQDGIVAMLKGSGLQPVFVEDADADAREYILLESQGVEEDDTLDEGYRPHQDLVDESITLTVKCETAGKAYKVAKLIMDALLPATGQFGDRIVEGMWFGGIETGYEPPESGETKGKHLQMITLQFHHRGV